MKYLRRYIRRLIKETLEDESFFEGALKTGDLGMIEQALTLAEDMQMSIADLPWYVVDEKKMSQEERINFSFYLAEKLIKQVESGLVDLSKWDSSGGHDFKRFKENYQNYQDLSAKRPRAGSADWSRRGFARTYISNNTLEHLKSLSK